MTSASTERASMKVHEQEPYNAEPPRAALAEHVITPVEVFYGRNHGAMPEIDLQPYGGSIPGDKATAPEVLLAREMNGEALTTAHGAPVRVVVPGHIGARSVKWVERITAQDHPSDNFFQQGAYRLLPADTDTAPTRPGDGVALGPVALNSAILTPDDGDELPAGPTHVAGYAFAGDDRTVVRVDVPPGRVETMTRARDSTAAVQPECGATVWNPEGYVNNSWPTVTVTAS